MPDVRLASPQGKRILLATVLGSSMALLDSTVVNVALPRIGHDLDTSLAALQWTVNAYLVTLAGLILLGGSLGDRYGRRKIFVLGVVWFAAASLLCGLAPTDAVLIAARALQGIGGALLTPGSLALIQASFHPDDRSRAVGLWSGFGGIGAAVGPLPLLAGMGPQAYRSPTAFDAAFNRAMPICAGVLLLGSAFAYALVRRPGPGCRRPECRTHGNVAAPPLEADAEG